MTISRQLKDARKAQGLTQAEVACRAGMCRENYARIERGDASTTLATLQAIVDALNITVTVEPLKA